MKIDSWITRLALALIAALTYLASHVPDGVGVYYLAELPLKTWILFIVNLGTGFFSPSLVKQLSAKKQV